MAPTPSDKRFGAERVFFGAKWNVFMVLAGSVGLVFAALAALRAFQATGTSVAALAWGFLALVLAHSVWTSARRLMRLRKTRT